MTDALTALRIGDLVEDWNLYPRERVNEMYVHELARALRAGHRLPPILVDGATLRIVDGYHRTRAHREVFGEDGTIDAIVRTYPDEQALFEEAVRLNAVHGQRLSGVDRIRVVLLGRKLGMDDGRIAVMLSTTPAEVQRIAVRVAVVEHEPERVVPLKRSVVHLSGRTITLDQVVAHRSAPGSPYRMLVRQLIDALRHNLARHDDPQFLTLLRELGDEIEAFLERAGASVEQS